MILEAKKQHYQIGLLQQSNTQICLQAKARVQSGKIHITPVGGVTCWENTELPLL